MRLWYLAIRILLVQSSVRASGNLLEDNTNVRYVCSYQSNIIGSSTSVLIANTFSMTSSDYSQSSDEPSFCLTKLNCGGISDQLTITFDLIDSVVARSIMPVLSKATTNHPIFSSANSDITYSLKVVYADSSTSTLFSLNPPSNKVQSITAKSIASLKLSLKRGNSNTFMTPDAADFKFCIDRMFVFNEYYLNEKLSV